MPDQGRGVVVTTGEDLNEVTANVYASYMIAPNFGVEALVSSCFGTPVSRAI